MGIEEKAAYVRGLIDGLDLDNEKKETRIIKAISEFIEICSEKVVEFGEIFEETRDRIRELEDNFEFLDKTVCKIANKFGDEIKEVECCHDFSHKHECGRHVASHDCVDDRHDLMDCCDKDKNECSDSCYSCPCCGGEICGLGKFNKNKKVFCPHCKKNVKVYENAVDKD